MARRRFLRVRITAAIKTMNPANTTVPMMASQSMIRHRIRGRGAGVWGAVRAHDLLGEYLQHERDLLGQTGRERRDSIGPVARLLDEHEDQRLRGRAPAKNSRPGARISSSSRSRSVSTLNGLTSADSSLVTPARNPHRPRPGPAGA